jgi:hypothetical protein
MTVFIAYAREDEDMALALDRRLHNWNITSFIDTDQIRVGDNWRNIRLNALKSSVALLLICTPESMESNEVQFEWSYAMGKEIPVLPLIYRQSSLQPELGGLQALDFTDPNKRPWAVLRQRA